MLCAGLWLIMFSLQNPQTVFAIVDPITWFSSVTSWQGHHVLTRCGRMPTVSLIGGSQLINISRTLFPLWRSILMMQCCLWGSLRSAPFFSSVFRRHGSKKPRSFQPVGFLGSPVDFWCCVSLHGEHVIVIFVRRGSYHVKFSVAFLFSS